MSRKWASWFHLDNIPTQAEEHEVKIAIARAYHASIAQGMRRRPADEEGQDMPALMNFLVELKQHADHSGRLQSRGALLIPHWSDSFKKYIMANPVMVPYFPNWNDKSIVHSQKLRITQNSDRMARKPDVDYLRSTPWQHPRYELLHKQRVASLKHRPQVMEIQFGFDHFRHAKKGRQEHPVHQFYVEWCRVFDSRTDSRAFLEFIDAIHTIQIEIGDPTVLEYNFIKVRYENVKEIWIKDTTLIFLLWNSPILEKGPVEYDESRPRSRLSGLDAQHQRVMSIYSKQFRVSLYSKEELGWFKEMAGVVGFRVSRAPLCLDTDDGLADIHNSHKKRTKRRAGDYLNYLSDDRMLEINQGWLATIQFPIAFQISILMQNALLNPVEIRAFRPLVEELMPPRSHRSIEEVAHLLSGFAQSIPSWNIESRLESSLEDRFKKFKESFWGNRGTLLKTLKPGWFWGYRAIITPTTITLNGPTQEQSNGIIRKYQANSSSFLRVSFTDEDRVQMRWDQGIDGEAFVRERLGDILNGGISIAGRHYEFLGYSNSGLREHSLWFVTPFDEHGDHITADTIRSRIGDFDIELETQPAKLGARLAQAFSTTEPSIELQEGEIEKRDDLVPVSEEIQKSGDKEDSDDADPDSKSIGRDVPVSEEIKKSRDKEDSNNADPDSKSIGRDVPVSDEIKMSGEKEGSDNADTDDKPASRQFTDGYGCMSLELRDEIWRALNPGIDPLPNPVPAAFQVRIGGAKGVLGINPKLEGRKVILYRSMRKFESEDFGLHIANKFDRPLPLYLNRPLVAILEHQGVKIEYFKRLQEKAISEINDTLLSISEKTADFFAHRYLGRAYYFSHIMRHLAQHGITRIQLEEAPHPMLDFFLKSLNVASIHIDHELKYRARIPVPNGLSLVGVADVHEELEEGEVYICTQKTDENWKYFPEKPGNVYVTRSPSIHPGDVQRFEARHPPKGSIYEQYPMINTIVFPCKGKRPAASMLGGGDLDGDLFQIIPETEDFKLEIDPPAEYPPPEIWTVERRATMSDIAEFVTKYINSDKMGIISIQHLIISDQSRDGLHDPKCMKLAELHSKAVDFAKSGTPVPFTALPKKLHPYVPDFHYTPYKLEDQTKYYESPKALGVLFRNVKGRSLPTIEPDVSPTPLSKNPIWIVLLEKSRPHLPPGVGKLQEAHVKAIFNEYVRELKGIKSIYSIGHSPLSEEEVFMGTILEHTNNRKRNDMSSLLRDVSGQLVEDVRSSLKGFREDPLHVWLARSLYGWQWAYSEAASKNPDGSVVKDRRESQCSFGMIALLCAFECLQVINEKRPDLRPPKP